MSQKKIAFFPEAAFGPALNSVGIVAGKANFQRADRQLSARPRVHSGSGGGWPGKLLLYPGGKLSGDTFT